MNKNQPSKPSKPADPKRFKDFRSELEDKTGFKVLGSNHVFLYDKNGGWFDEYGNYYNKDGVPKPAPRSEEETKENTESQDKGEEFEIRVWNLPYNTTEEAFEKFLTEKKIEWIYFEFEYNAQDKFNGTAYLTLDQANADKFWELEGTQYDGRDLRMEEYYEEEEEEDPADILAKEYVHGGEAEEDPLDHYEDLYLNTENKQIIESYPKDKEIQITAWNFPYSTTEDDFEKLMVEKKIDWILFEFELNAQDKFNGRVHLTFDRANAEKFIELNGQPFNGRDIKIQVEKAASVEIEAEDAEGDDEEEEEEDGEEGVEGVEGEEGEKAEKAEKADKDPAPETQ